MPEDRTLKNIEERLARLESAFSNRPAAAQLGGVSAQLPGTVVDPAPWGGQPGGWMPIRVPIGPIGDPAPWGGQPGGWVPIRTPIGPIGDPPPWGGGFVGVQPGGWTSIRGPIGNIGDPPPFDLGRLTSEQLEASLHSISAERIRLDSMETMIKGRLAALKEAK